MATKWNFLMAGGQLSIDLCMHPLSQGSGLADDKPQALAIPGQTRAQSSDQLLKEDKWTSCVATGRTLAK